MLKRFVVGWCLVCSLQKWEGKELTEQDLHLTGSLQIRKAWSLTDLSNRWNEAQRVSSLSPCHPLFWAGTAVCTASQWTILGNWSSRRKKPFLGGRGGCGCISGGSLPQHCWWGDHANRGTLAEGTKQMEAEVVQCVAKCLTSKPCNIVKRWGATEEKYYKL